MTFNLDSMLAPQAVIVRNEVHPATIAIVGEAPGNEEVEQGRPFVGASGRLLFGILSNFSIHRHHCAVLNVSQHRLNKRIGDEDKIDWDSHEIQSGLTQLAVDIAAVKPNIVICLGSIALRAAMGEPKSVHNWRGSLFRSPVWGTKCIAAIHPAAVLRTYEWIQLLRFDLGKAVRESASADLLVPTPTIRTGPSLSETLDTLSSYRTAKQPITLDIEGHLNRIRCIGFANSANSAFVVPLIGPGDTHYWSEADEALVIVAICNLLADTTVPKILQNYLYDGFVLAHDLHTPIRALVDDTMVKHWELLPELEKALGVQASIYTNVPYYKDEVDSPDGPALWTYCGRDCTTTHQINDELSRQLSGKPAERHYRFNVSLLAPLNYMQLRGVRIDTVKRAELLRNTQTEVYELQHKVNQAGATYRAYYPLPTDPDKLRAYVAEQCCYKRGSYATFDDLLSMPKAPHRDTIARIVELCKVRNTLTPVAEAELDMLLERHINVDSSTQLCDLLYAKMALPTQYKKVKGRRTDKATTDVLALLTLFGKTRNEDLTRILQLRALLGRMEGLNAIEGPNNRLYFGCNLVGTETGRVQTYKSAFGGKSIQTETSRHKYCYIPDDDHWIGELDLSGADLWTVAAECAHVGDTTLLEDLKAGISAHKLLCLAYADPKAIQLDRAALKAAVKTVSKKGWLYYACKRVAHMSNYGGGADTMSDQITKDAWNKEQELVYVEPAICARLQAYYFARYPGVKSRMRWLESQLRQTGQYTSAGGHTRIFFGRRDDHKTVGEFYADGPQETTTYVTNLALHRLWHDPRNRNNDQLIVEPLFHRHDALGFQFPKRRTDDCVAWLREWFVNTVTVSGIDITIPAEGGYGPSWGELTNIIL